MDYDFCWFDVWDGEKNSYNGNAYGGGISYGYQLRVAPLERGVRRVFGYLHFEYDKYAFLEEMRLSGKFATVLGINKGRYQYRLHHQNKEINL